VHNTSHAFKVKQLNISFLKVLYAPELALLKGKRLASMMLHEVVPQALLQQPPSLVESLL
jgi:hypothetical protein